MLKVVIDDAGRGQESNPAFVLAGYVARVQNWCGFADEWQAILNERPAIEYLKGYDAFHRSGQFTDWPEKERDRKVCKLIKPIHQFAKLSVTLAVNGQTFDRLLRSRKGGLRNIYPLAVAAITTRVLFDRSEQKTFEKLDFVFDEGMLHANVFEQAFKDMMISLPKRATELVGNRPHMENDLEFIPLQAADLLASYLRFKLAAEERGEVFDNRVFDCLTDGPAENLDATLTTDALYDLRRRIEQKLLLT